MTGRGTQAAPPAWPRGRALALTAILLAGCGDDRAGGGDAGGPCSPSERGPFWIVEGEPFSFEVTCALDVELGDDGFDLEPLPPGASWDGDAGVFEWTPGLDQAAVYHLEVTARGSGDQQEIVVGVADALDVDGNQPIADPLTYTHELGLPVLFLSPAPTAEEPYVPVSVVYGGRSYQAEGKLRGASSLDYPKKSYTLKFDNPTFSDLGEDGGFREKDRIVLTSTFDDNSYIRQWLAFELWSRLDPTIQVQAYTAVVYIDGEYFGIYHVTDHIDDEMVEAHGLSEDGNIYKAVNHDANFRLTSAGGGDKDTPHDGYEKKEGLPAEGNPDAFADLDELVTFVATASDQVFAEEIAQRIELGDYEKWWMLVTAIRADDSAGKNSYHYHDAVRTWRVAPWDFNASFGQSWTTSRTPSAPASLYTSENHLFQRLLDDPELGAAMRDHAREAMDDGGPLAPDAVLGLIDQLAARVEPSAERDWSRWEDAYRAFDRWSDRDDWTDVAGETAYLRAWTEARLEAFRAAIE